MVRKAYGFIPKSMNNVRENPNDEKQMEESHKITRKDKKQPEEQ